MSSDLDALYKNARLCLWVEDNDTRVWLDALWEGMSPTIRVLVAGGQSNVEALCNHAHEAGYKHVFGLIDMDFGTSNFDRWQQLSAHERVYRLNVHELENLLLDTDAMAGQELNSGDRKAAEVSERLSTLLHEHSHWVSLTSFLTETWGAATQSFPKKRHVRSQEEALGYLRENEWFTTHAHTCPSLASLDSIQAGLERTHQRAQTQLTDESWKLQYPGKEIFRALYGYVHPKGKGAAGRTDLIKAIGKWQRQRHRTPEAILLLRKCLEKRITPTPAHTSPLRMP